jgi:hypothetical protein
VVALPFNFDASPNPFTDALHSAERFREAPAAPLSMTIGVVLSEAKDLSIASGGLGSLAGLG